MNARCLPPDWSETAVRHGVDPLGMQNSSVSKYQALVPGISNVTLRMRYYGLYAWLSDRYAREVGARDLEKWRWHVRRAEILYALIVQQQGMEAGVAGVTWAAAALDRATERIEFSSGADPGATSPYLKQAWGAYGAAYYSQLRATGVLTEAADNPVPVPSADSGDRLALAFASTQAGLKDLFFDTLHRGSVTAEELAQLAPLAPSSIPQDSEERVAYEDLLFCRTANTPAGDHTRATTLTLLLHLSQQMEACPTAKDARWAFYTGRLPSGQPLKLADPALRTHLARWWLYQLDDLCHVCLESLLKYTLDVLGTYPAGVPTRSLVADVTQRIVSVAGPSAATWASFATNVASSCGWGKLAEPTSEHHRVDRLLNAARPAAIVADDDALRSVELLAILWQRARAHGADFAEHEPEGQGVRSVHTEMAYLNGAADQPFADVVSGLIRDRILSRHLWVALRKLRHQREYTFLVESDAGLLRLRRKDGPVLTTPRLDTSITFLKDIHLLDSSGITQLGNRLIAQ